MSVTEHIFRADNPDPGFQTWFALAQDVYAEDPVSGARMMSSYVAQMLREKRCEHQDPVTGLRCVYLQVTGSAICRTPHGFLALREVAA